MIAVSARKSPQSFARVGGDEEDEEDGRESGVWGMHRRGGGERAAHGGSSGRW